jgi:signal transduction histidine kinase
MAFRFSEAMSLETVSSALVEDQSLDAILTVIIDEAMQLLGAKDALVLLLEEGENWFQVCARAGPGLTGLTSRRMSVRDSLNGLVVTTGKPLVSNDALTDPRANQARAGRLNVHSVAIAPLRIRNRTIGTIAVHNKRVGYFSQTDVAILCSFANQAAVAIENAQLFSKLLRARDELQHKAEELQELLVQTINIQEEERRRIAADIHDRVVSRVVGALYELETCIQLHQQSKPLEGKLQLLEQLLNDAVDKTRTSIYNLWPAILDHMGLASALREVISHDQERTGIRHSLRVYGKPYRLQPPAKIAAYRIVQEALSNIHQHAAAESVSVSVRYSPQQVRITIRDDGQGFDMERVMLSPPRHHFGLIGMRERALSVGGQLCLESEPGKGSRVTLDIPVGSVSLESE